MNEWIREKGLKSTRVPSSQNNPVEEVQYEKKPQDDFFKQNIKVTLQVLGEFLQYL